MPVKTASERLVQVCTQFEVNATDGVVHISSTGEDSTLLLSGAIIEACSTHSSIGIHSNGDAGFINLSTTSDSTNSCIYLSASSSTLISRCEVKPNGICLAHGNPLSPGIIYVSDGNMLLSMGPSLIGSSISLKPDSITLQVGPLTSLTLTADGIVLASGVTKMALGVQGIKEELGPITRSLGLMGHSMVAAESAVDVTPVGVNAKGPTGSFAFNATGQLSALLLTESADAIMNKKAPLANISS
jgi:hypothetical protein